MGRKARLAQSRPRKVRHLPRVRSSADTSTSFALPSEARGSVAYRSAGGSADGSSTSRGAVLAPQPIAPSCCS